jgi:hypothetical protein
MTQKTESSLVEVTLETLLGARYVFPDMPRSTLEGVIKSSILYATGKVTLANASSAVLTLPSRIVKSISFDGEVKWVNVAALRELPETDRT